MAVLPSDPSILKSYLNTLLRDRYDSLHELAYDMDLDIDDLEKKIRDAGLRYDDFNNSVR